MQKNNFWLKILYQAANQQHSKSPTQWCNFKIWDPLASKSWGPSLTIHYKHSIQRVSFTMWTLIYSLQRTFAQKLHCENFSKILFSCSHPILHIINVSFRTSSTATTTFALPGIFFWQHHHLHCSRHRTQSTTCFIMRDRCENLLASWRQTHCGLQNCLMLAYKQNKNNCYSLKRIC